MDPNAAIKALDRAEMEHDRPGIAELCDALIGWLVRDGFPPRFDAADWRASLTRSQLIAHFRTVRHVAEMP